MSSELTIFVDDHRESHFAIPKGREMLALAVCFAGPYGRVYPPCMTWSAIVTEQHPPMQSRLADWYRTADLVDSFAVQLPMGSDANIRSVGQAILGQPAPWFKALLSIRDGVVRPFGLQTSAELRGSSAEEDRIDFFPILSAYDNELILGKDDQHLNFRISVLLQKGVSGPDLVFATTAVRCNNRLGRIYLATIKPFHRLVVRSNLRRAVNTGFAVSTKR